MKFDCPSCKQTRHVNEHDTDGRGDACWYCGTLVPYTAAELAQWDPPAESLTEGERANLEAQARARSEQFGE